MKRSTISRTGGIAAVALTLSMGLAACSSSDSDSDTTASDTSSDTATSAAPSSEAPSSDAATDAGADTFGDGCKLIPTSGAGSFNAMVQDPVATAASTNPLLKTLVAAVGVAGLGDTLNGLDAATVFAPTDDAFAALPKKTLDGLLADPTTLGKVLTHHVLPENDDPTAVVGTKTTVNGDDLTIAGDTSGMTVDDGTVKANVLCGNIPTANATVYVIDAVLAGAKTS